MTWTWRYENQQGDAVDRPRSDSYPSQSDAESWLGEHWRDLLEHGIHQVALLEDGNPVYGPMGLEKPEDA
jgi:hypothetical protein